MIRVIYRWRVSPDKFTAFKKSWSDATNHIHDTVPGARGSFMLKACQGDEVVTVARWDSLESWQEFFAHENPPQMLEMRKLGERLSVEAFEEVEDYTQ